MVKALKKSLWLFLLLTAFLASVVGTIPIGLAQGGLPTMSVDPAVIEDLTFVPGTTFTVDIVVDHVEKLWAYQYELTFNPDVLQGVWYDEDAYPPIPVEESGWLGSLGGLVFQSPGPGWDNVNGKLQLTGASVLNPATMRPDPAYCPTATEKTVLSTATFEVIGYGDSPLELGLESALLDSTGVYIIKKSLPIYKPQFKDGFFRNIMVPLVSVEPSVISKMVGETFTINVSISKVIDLYSYEFRLNWNSTILDATSITEGPFLGTGGTTTFSKNINNVEGWIEVVCSLEGDVPGVDGNGKLATITFDVKEIGKTDLRLSDLKLLGSTGAEFPYEQVDGSFNSIPVHDIAITAITVTPIRVSPGEPVFINVTVKNEGDVTENFNVTIKYDKTVIAYETVGDLVPGALRIVSFTWNTTNIPGGKYTVKAEASVHPKETDKKDNTSDGVLVTITGHNIAVISVEPSPTKVTVGKSVSITVLVRNKGTETETFNVTAFYDGNTIGIEPVNDLAPGSSKLVVFTWSTESVAKGDYVIKATLPELPGETDTGDNTKTGGTVTVELSEQSLPMFLLVPIVIVVLVIVAGTFLFLRKRSSSGA